MSDLTGDRLYTVVLAPSSESARCGHCDAKIHRCDESGCDQRRPRGWRTARLNTPPSDFSNGRPYRLTVYLSEAEATNLAHAADTLEKSIPETLTLLAGRIQVWYDGHALGNLGDDDE
ncbi:hypothetical protein Misp01_54580 [Microtetraspora sp. NBRC 13810]|uniref:hypothetical protein n=1 Tax=Microtetraspora sp. NBRC 13810 TaxID=3030990 RepID=UPI0024A09103|nr:hypothetical protein [Microtetraspora sp. NBRC 13810]GLW10330.1 hypothetical protein Misp01_54580 [Microtetraspora sp. NBRC 13810]